MDFHMIDVKLFQTLPILKLSLLFLQRTNSIFYKADSQKFQLKCFLFCSEKVMLNLRETQLGVFESSNLSVLTALEGRQKSN